MVAANEDKPPANGGGGSGATDSSTAAQQATGKSGKKKEEEELTEEDKELIAHLQLLVDRVKEPDTSLHLPALETMRALIRSATSSMTSVPKPLKFLRKHFDTLVTAYETMVDGHNKRFLSDILSVLAMTISTAGTRPTLRYRLSGSDEPFGSWGHEYVRFLAAEVAQEYADRTKDVADPVEQASLCQDLFKIADEIVPFFMTHNAEADACDLLMELDRIHDVVPHIDQSNYARVCLYLSSCVSYVPEPEDQRLLDAVKSALLKLNLRPDALLIALRMNDLETAKTIFDECTDRTEKKQLAHILARQQIHFETDDSGLDDILNYTRLSERFLALGRELEILDPKVPEDVYKSHLENTRATLGSQAADSAKQNLASTFVNAFLNAGFGKDKLLGDDGNAWIHKHKDHGKISATAALGMIQMWDIEAGLTTIDKFLYGEDDNVKTGALLALGVLSATVRNDCDPALALLSDFVSNNNPTIRCGAITSLAIAYAGSRRTDVLDFILPTLGDTTLSPEIAGIAALAAGIVGVSSCNEAVSSTILETMLERDVKKLEKSSMSRFLSLGLGLLFLGRQQAAEAVLEGLKAVPDPIGKQAATLLDICAYAGTGNVLKVQKMIQICKDHLDPEKENDVHQTFAVLGIALIAMGEDVGTQMAYRSFNHLMHYGEPVIRRAVPLALGLLCVSKPQEIQIIDTLSKYSHDNDMEVAQSAIFALGLIGAGTNNARIAQMLRQLAAYYQKEPNTLFLVRVSQGLLHFAKGTITLNPYHSNRQIMSPIAVAGLLAVVVSMTDTKATILDKYHYLLYYISIAVFPRVLITLDESGKSLPVSVRVGQAVDVVGQAGRPKTITGFQTHTTPVLLGQGERAELATDEYIPVTSILEGFVILKPNPNYVKPEDGGSSSSSSSGGASKK